MIDTRRPDHIAAQHPAALEVMSQTEAVTSPVTQAHAEPEQTKLEKQEEKPQQKETDNKRLSSGTESDDDPVCRFRFSPSPTPTVTRQTASLHWRTPMLMKQATDPDDNFEDAVAHSPARSLTKRSMSYSKAQTPAQDDPAAEEPSDRKSGETHRSEDKRASKIGDPAVESADEVESLHEKPLPRRKSSSVSKRISSTSNLDNVSLDDDDAPPPPPGKRRRPHSSLTFDLY